MYKELLDKEQNVTIFRITKLLKNVLEIRGCGKQTNLLIVIPSRVVS